MQIQYELLRTTSKRIFESYISYSRQIKNSWKISPYNAPADTSKHFINIFETLPGGTNKTAYGRYKRPGYSRKFNTADRNGWSSYRGTQRQYSSKPLKHSIVKRILVFERQIQTYFYLYIFFILVYIFTAGDKNSPQF